MFRSFDFFLFLKQIKTKTLNRMSESPAKKGHRAALFAPGTKKKGQDGKLWVVSVRRNGVHFWKKWQGKDTIWVREYYGVDPVSCDNEMCWD